MSRHPFTYTKLHNLQTWHTSILLGLFSVSGVLYRSTAETATDFADSKTKPLLCDSNDNNNNCFHNATVNVLPTSR